MDGKELQKWITPIRPWEEEIDGMMSTNGMDIGMVRANRMEEVMGWMDEMEV